MAVNIEMEHLSTPLLQSVNHNNSDNQQSELTKYWWLQIHHVAQVTDPQLLKEAIESLNVTELNTLTIFSENALHVLLEYGKPQPVYTVRISRGDTSKTCHIIPTEQPAMVECVKILVDAGIDINHNNFWNETPILLALKYRYWKTIEYLLECSQNTYLDLDTCKDPNTGKTARELLKVNEIDVDTLPNDTDGHHKNEYLLFTYLKSNDEEAFLNFNCGNIKRFVNCFDGSNFFQSSGTMLELCFRKAFFEYKQAANNSDDDGDIYETFMLKTFCSNKGLVRCICHLLENGADSTARNPRSNESIIEAVVSRGYYPLLVLLLHHNNDVPVDIIFGLIKRRPSSNYVLLLLLSKLEMLQAEHKVSAWECTREVLDRLMTLAEGTVYTKCLKLGGPLLGIDLFRANEAEVKEYLDDIVDVERSEIRCDGLVRDSDGKYSESETLYAIATHHKKQKLLLHPAITWFIKNKWKRMRWYFYVNLSFYIALWLVLFTHIVLFINGYTTIITAIILIALLTIDVLKELTELAFYRWNYLKDKSNYLEIIVIVCSIIMIVTKSERMAVLAMLAASMNLMLVLGQLPSLTKYMVIFGTSKYFFEYTFFYLVQFLSFAICFALTHPSTENNVFTWVFQTLIFFTGEFNDEVLHPEKFPIFGRVLLVAFVFSMTIILNNLLVGLIVTDMDQLQKTGKLYKQIKTVKFFKKIDLILERINGRLCAGFIGNANIFQPGKPKTLNFDWILSNVFDDEDHDTISELAEKQLQKSKEKLLLPSLYDYIMNKVTNSGGENQKNKIFFEKMEEISRLLKVFVGKDFNLDNV